MVARKGRNRLHGLKIGVLYGGPSAEREVSLESGEAVAKELTKAGYKVQRILIDGSFDEQIARELKIDLAFLALHGAFGEDGTIQMILDEAGIPFTGSGATASAMAFDKIQAKLAYDRHGVRTAPWLHLNVEDFRRMQASKVPCAVEMLVPFVVKPSASGSSLGISIVRRNEDLEAALQKAFEFDEEVLIERFIKGREFTVGVLGEEALPVAELIVSSEFYDYHAKYVDDRTKIVCPAEISDTWGRRLKESALAAHRALGCEDVSRTDMIVDEEGYPWVLETNTLPGMTSHSLLPKICDRFGIGFLGMLEQLLSAALERKSRRISRLANRG